MTILFERFYADLFIAKFAEPTIGYSRVEIALEIFRKSRQSFVAELASTAQVFRSIVAMKTHIKPLNLQCNVGGWDVSLWEHLQNMQHLFKSMEMVHRRD